MSPHRVITTVPPRVLALRTRLAIELGREIHDERVRRGWRLSDLATRAGIGVSTLQGVEAGAPSSLDGYVRLGSCLGLEPVFSLSRKRPSGAGRAADPVHAAMGDAEASHLRDLGFEVLLDEPYQHYQFAGRADLVAIDRGRRALLHLENRTRFPDIQAFAGSFNAKRAYLAVEVGTRLGIRGGFASVSHVTVALWSAEVLHVLRLREASFRAVCTDDQSAFHGWWTGAPPAGPHTSSSLVLFDPIPGVRRSRRCWIGLDAVATVRPRHAGYAAALADLHRVGRA